MKKLLILTIFSVLLICLLIPSTSAENTSYVYSFNDKTVSNATITISNNGSFYNSWTTDELGSYDLDIIKTYLINRFKPLPNGYTFYIQVQKYPFDRTWKLQKIDATHVKVNDGNTYTTSTIWAYLKNNLRLTESAGLGYADRTGITVSSTVTGVRVDGSGDDAKVFIPGNLHYKYTVQHVNDSGNITDEFVVYPQLIDSDYYVVFDADEWSYYTVDGSLIEVGITDMRLVGDTVEITGDGYDRLVLQADVSGDWWANKLLGWNQKQLVDVVNGNPWLKQGDWYAISGTIAQIIDLSGADVVLHKYSNYGTQDTFLNGRQAGNFVIDVSNNNYKIYFYIDNDLGSSKDTVVEVFTPDNIDHTILEMWNGTAGAYQEVLNDSTYTAANLIHLNNSSTGLDFALYESGQRGDTVSAIYGNTSKPDQTVSSNYGCLNRTLMLFTLPADDGADSATSGASQVKLRLTVYYNPEGIIDNSDYTNHGTQHGGVTRVRDGQIGEAIEFDGVNDYIDCGNDESLNITDAITIEAWLNLQSSASSHILSRDTYSYMFGTSSGRLYSYIGNTTSRTLYFYNENYVPELYTYHHVIITVNGSDVCLYINGTLKYTETQIVNLVGGTDILYIGSEDGTGNFLNSNIDEVRIYNRALNSTEAAEHYNGTFNNETGLVFHSPMELTPSGAATYEFSYDTNQYYGLKNLELDASGGVSTLMLAKAGTQNVTYITNESGNAITGMTVRADENELIDELFITYASTPTNLTGLIINQSAVDIDTDSDGDDVPDAFEDANITANKNAQGGELKWDYLWGGCFNHPNATGYMYYTNLTNGSGLYSTEIQTASTTGTANISMNTAGAGEEYNFTVNSGIVDWMNVTSGLSVGVDYQLNNSTGQIETQYSDGSANFTTNLSAGTYYINEFFNPPATMSNTTGNYWVNYTWTNGTGSITDSWNISHNGTWTNGTTDNWFNTSVGEHGWSNITIYAWNDTIGLSNDYIEDTMQVPNRHDFTYTGESLTPSIISQYSYFTYSVNINDSDGTISSAKVSFNSINYTMSQSGDTWSATIEGAIPTIYRIDYVYATDNDSITNSTTSALTCTVVRAGGSGASGAGVVTTPTPTPTVTPEPTPVPVEVPEEIAEDIINRLTMFYNYTVPPEIQEPISKADTFDWIVFLFVILIIAYVVYNKYNNEV